MDANGMGETPRDLTRPRMVPHKNSWKSYQNTIYRCNLQTRSRERIAVSPDKASRKWSAWRRCLSCTKRYDWLRECRGVVLESNSQICPQDQQEQDERTSCDQRSGSKLPWESERTKNPSFRTSSRRRRSTSSARNRRISSLTKHKDLRALLNIFKTAMPWLHLILGSRHCLLCSCGRCLRMSRNEREVDKSNNYVVSIPGYVIKKNNKRGARHGPSERQRMYYKAKELLHKASQNKHGEHSSILARWLSDDRYRKSLSDIGWTAKDIVLFDRMALENHSYVATEAERIQNSEHWILKLNQDGAQQP